MRARKLRSISLGLGLTTTLVVANALVDEESFCKTYQRGKLPTFDPTRQVWEQAFEINGTLDSARCDLGRPLRFRPERHMFVPNFGPLLSHALTNSLPVLRADAYPLASVVVPIQVSHPSIADLRITLSAEAPESEAQRYKGTHLVKQVVLKEMGQGSGEFFEAIYADEAEEGAVTPVQSLGFLFSGSRPSVMAASGGSEGMWIVRIENTGASRPVVDANLALCQIETGQTGVVTDVVQAYAGGAQPALPADAPWIIDGEIVSEEDMAAFRRAAALALVNVRDGDGSSMARGIFDGLKEGTKTKLELLKEKLKDENEDSRWRPGQVVSNAITGIGDAVGNLFDGDGLGLRPGSQGDGLGATILVGGLMGDKPDEIVWSRALPNIDSLGGSLPKIDEGALLGVAEKVRGAGADLAQALKDWKPSQIKDLLGDKDRLPSLPDLGHLPPLNLPPLSLPKLPPLDGSKLPTFDDLSSSLESIATKLSAGAQDWAGKRADQREHFLSGIESGLEGAKSRLEAGMSSLKPLELPKPDLSGVKDKLTDALSQVKERQKRLEKPREEFKNMLSTAVEKTVKQQVEAVAGQFDLDAVEQRLVEAGVDTDELLDSLSGADLDALLDGGVGLNFRNGLSMEGAFGEQVVGQLLGIEDPEELDALWNGLKEAGFQDLMGEFLNPARLR